jgi:hypothetical protein
MDQLLLLLALHGGAQTTSFLGDGDDGSGYRGPRFEAEGLVQPKPWFAVGLAASYSHATERGPEPDVIDGPDYEMTNAVTFASVGIRAYLESEYVFLGLGVWSTWDRDAFSAMGVTSNSWGRFISPDVIVGGNVSRFGDYRVQLMADAALARPGFADDVIQLSVMLGVQRVSRL